MSYPATLYPHGFRTLDISTKKSKTTSIPNLEQTTPLSDINHHIHFSDYHIHGYHVCLAAGLIFGRCHH